MMRFFAPLIVSGLAIGGSAVAAGFGDVADAGFGDASAASPRGPAPDSESAEACGHPFKPPLIRSGTDTVNFHLIWAEPCGNGPDFPLTLPPEPVVVATRIEILIDPDVVEVARVAVNPLSLDNGELVIDDDHGVQTVTMSDDACVSVIVDIASETSSVWMAIVGTTPTACDGVTPLPPEVPSSATTSTTTTTTVAATPPTAWEMDCAATDPEAHPPFIRSGVGTIAMEFSSSISCAGIHDGPVALGHHPSSRGVVERTFEVVIDPLQMPTARVTVRPYRSDDPGTATIVLARDEVAVNVADAECYGVYVLVQGATHTTSWIALVSTDSQSCAEFHD